MLPSVAVAPQFQPHHHLDHRLNYDPFARPYDMNGATLQANKPAFNNSIPRSRMQFPHPVQRSDSQDLGSNNDPHKVANVGEHALRRKTPNGTLAAGYDGTPGDRAIQPPAAKHILVSSLESGQVLPSQSTLPVENWQSTPLDQTQYQNFPPVYNKQDPGRTNNGLSTDQLQGGGGTGPSWVRSLNPQPGMDSVLHQTLPMQPSQRYYMHNGPSIPTVLPATLQPYLSPTAPVSTGPYGPYWPDGAYIPYRPAALRDSRFLPTSPYPNDPNAPQLYDLHQSQFGPTSLPASGLSTQGFSWNQAPPGSLNNEPFLQQQQQQNFPPRHSYQKPLCAFNDPQHALPYHVQGASGLNANIPSHPQGEAVGWSGSHTNRNVPPSVPEISSRAQNAEFKEKVLSWAHSVYVDLLATLNARRQSVSKTSADGQPQRPSKPSIYPKPPRQPGLDFSSSQPDMPRQNSYSSSRYDLHSQNAPQQMGSFNAPSYLPPNRQPVAQRPTATLPRVPGPYNNESSTMASAASALEMLSHLCMESNWEWIDGMLLGGCLAYGLGDYHKAMRWYSRIIDRDATHVEAISNLAATLLALDRRDEALQHWLRAVKLRPSYFEAVEHLIGLLCSNHRGKEAVNIIEFVENSLRVSKNGDCFRSDEHASETESDAESTESYERAAFDYDNDLENSVALNFNLNDSNSAGFASSGYAIPGSDNGRMLALVHAKGNMLYSLGDNAGAAAAFEDAILIAAGRRRHGIKSLIKQIIAAFTSGSRSGYPCVPETSDPKEPVLLLYPETALRTASLVFPPYGNPPGLQYVPEGLARKAAISTTSNSLLSLAKIYQDGMSQSAAAGTVKPASPGVRDILALYYLSLSLQPSPSTANNVGILLAGIQNNTPVKPPPRPPGKNSQIPEVPGVVPGSGVSLALAYYNYGLGLDSRHAHLYTNLGSLLKDIGQLQAAIRMYEQAVQCDGNFDIALANLANAVKDAGRINDAIGYYKRAVRVNPDFAEAVCGLANALNSVCNWVGRGGVVGGYGFQDRWHVDDQGMLRDAAGMETGSGWIKRVVDIVDRQLRDGETWGRGLLSTATIEQLCAQLTPATASGRLLPIKNGTLATLLQSWAGKRWEGARIVKLIERAIRAITWQWYQDRHVYGKEYPLSKYRRPQLPAALTAPNAPTVLPFHTFTCPLSAKQIRHISQRNGLRISCSTLRSPWLPSTVYPPPSPPNPYLRVGYVSSDFNNHPLAHLMQSVFGLHNPNRVKAFCYATTPSDNSVHRRQIEREAPVFYDASSWSTDRLVEQIVKDGIHILVNLNGYTRGARNEVFAARPAPIHMSFMGFAGTLGAEWCDYILADELSIPRDTLSPGRRDYRIEDRIFEEDHAEEAENWVYGERIVYTRDTFFCCDHRQSGPDSDNPHITWEEEQERRWKMRKELFPNLSDDAIIFGNFNQLYKIEPTTFRTWLRILSRVPNAVLWLLRFPDIGEQNLRQTALAWAGQEVASRIIFTDVAPKQQHIARAQICDLFLDTPECNAHTTAADTLWSGTPILTFPRYKYKMCSRMASSILTSALPSTEEGRQARNELVASSDEDYENKAVRLGHGMRYEPGGQGRATGRLMELRKMLFTNRWQSKLFDTRRWVNDLEEAYEKVWNAWVRGEEGDIWL
ncbi:hypothetical protein VTN77DRAFT_4151 [Rasamsonia byssochlamydoides]|uniref:uncharacterized protein n=1 Tax=Rasamsonia byssochlamydoides TaxID=89139 RepID=UPI00374291D8